MLVGVVASLLRTIATAAACTSCSLKMVVENQGSRLAFLFREILTKVSAFGAEIFSLKNQLKRISESPFRCLDLFISYQLPRQQGAQLCLKGYVLTRGTGMAVMVLGNSQENISSRANLNYCQLR